MSTQHARGGAVPDETVPVRRTWEGAATRVQAPLYREPRPPLGQAAAWRIRREMAWTVAGWLLVAFLVLLCAAMALFAVHIWHIGGPLTGSG